MWNEKKSPSRLEKRFEFDNYQITSNFMSQIDDLCKEKEIYPNISFGGKFVSITIFFQSDKISIKEKELSTEIDNRYEKLN